MRATHRSIRALGDRLFQPTFRTEDGLHGYVPVSGFMCAELDHVVHAARVSLGPSRRITVDTLCAIQKEARRLLVPADNDHEVVLVPAWPPPPRIVGLSRCDECFAVAGITKPDPMWAGLALAREEIPA